MKSRTAVLCLIALLSTSAVLARPAATDPAWPNTAPAHERDWSSEQSAVPTLRRLAFAQARVKAIKAIDTDADGGAEYAYFGELAGTHNLRFYDAAADAAGIGPDTLDPPLLPPVFGNVAPDVLDDGVVRAHGYIFKIFLPDVTGAGRVPGIGELSTGGADAAEIPDSDQCEVLWCCYAWPVKVGPGSRRAYFLNQEGLILATANAEAQYEGLLDVPHFDAAFSNETGGNDMLAPLGITAKIGPKGFAANDGNAWRVVPTPLPERAP